MSHPLKEATENSEKSKIERTEDNKLTKDKIDSEKSQVNLESSKSQYKQDSKIKDERDNNLGSANQGIRNENISSFNNNSGTDLKMDINPYDTDNFQLQPLKLRSKPKDVAQNYNKKEMSTSRKSLSERDISLRKFEVESFDRVFMTYDKTKETDEYKRLLKEGRKLLQSSKEKYIGKIFI